MVTPASDDLGERVALFVLSGETVRHAADVFGVSVASEVTWTERHRATGSAAARPMGGRRRDVMAPGRGSALARLAGHPSPALRALQAELTERGVVVSCGAVWHVRARRSPQPQKDCSASEVHRPEIARKRARRRRYQDRIDPARLRVSRPDLGQDRHDPLRGRAPRGQRLAGRHPHGHWRTPTFRAALRVDPVEAPCLFNRPVNGEGFTAWVEHAPVPTLRPGDVVVFDNPGSHKGRAVRAAIRNAGAHLLFLPPCSPDLNPIEMVFAKVKTLFRKADERGVQASGRRFGTLLDTFTPIVCQADLRHAGYVSM